VGCTFVLAAILTIISLEWANIQPRIPFLAGFLAAIAATRIAWFFAGIFPALVVGMRVQGLLSQRENNKLPKEWIEPCLAITAFGKRELVDSFYKLERDIRTLAEEIKNLQNSYETFMRASIVDQAKANEYIQQALAVKHQQSSKETEIKQLNARQTECWNDLLLSLDEELKSGRVVAKGFLSPHKPGAAEIAIPASEWRFLELKVDESKASGASVQYMAILLGRVS
jgi:hypothetical protein